MKFRFAPLLVVLCLSLKVLAQSDFCAEFLLPTLEEVSATCQGMGRNEICYGNNEVEATFVDESAVSFAQPSDIAPVPLLNSLQTSAYDSATGHFGLAVMQVQASNIPNTLPGQVLTFLLMGDVQVQNAVSAEEAFVPVEPIEVFTATAANIRVEPSSSSAIAWSMSANSSLAIDARNEAGDWFRVIGTEQTAWISTTVLIPNEAMSSLPVFTRASRTAMQAFYFEAGIGSPSCQEAPNQLIIQGPAGYETNLTINGAELRIGSTIALSQPAENVLRISVLDGYTIVNQISVPGGFSIDAVVSENNVQENTWGNFHSLPPQELEFHRQTAGSLGEDLVSYVPDVPTVEELIVIETAIAPLPTATPTPIVTLTPLPGVASSGSSSGGNGNSVACYTNGSSSLSLNGSINTFGNRRFYPNTSCSGNGSVSGAYAIVSGPDSPSAQSTCWGIGGTWIAYYAAGGWNTPSDWYECGT
jgi:hypothetical protein